MKSSKTFAAGKPNIPRELQIEGNACPSKAQEENRRHSHRARPRYHLLTSQSWEMNHQMITIDVELQQTILSYCKTIGC
jgi:hypothetical protein